MSGSDSPPPMAEQLKWLVRESARLRAELVKAENQVRHWKEQEAKQRRLHHEKGEWKHRALEAERRMIEAEARVAAIEIDCDEIEDERNRRRAVEADRDEARVKADTYQRMYYAEHGDLAVELDQCRAALERAAKDTGHEIVKRRRAAEAELTALQQRVAELTAELDRAYSQRNDVLDSMAAERTQAAAQANLGLATTRELLAELTARIDTDYVMGGGGLDYSTVNGRPGGDDHE